MLRVIIFLLLTLQLAGCFIAPGMKMSTRPPSKSIYSTYTQIKPNFIPIDVNLVRHLNETASITLNDAYYYHVGPHDILNIHVWGHPELQGPTGQGSSEQGMNAGPSLAPSGYLVSSDGDVFFPMLGSIHVAGKTTEQNRVVLTRLLKKYIRNPQLDVRVVGFRSKKIYVMGEVNKPGLQPLTDSPMTIVDAINLAGGLDQKAADPSHIFVIRGDFAKPDVYWLDAQSPDSLLLGENFRLRGDDVVFVSTAEIARWNRAIEEMLPTIQSAWFTYALVSSRS